MLSTIMAFIALMAVQPAHANPISTYMYGSMLLLAYLATAEPPPAALLALGILMAAVGTFGRKRWRERFLSGPAS